MIVQPGLITLGVLGTSCFLTARKLKGSSRFFESFKGLLTLFLVGGLFLALGQLVQETTGQDRLLFWIPAAFAFGTTIAWIIVK